MRSAERSALTLCSALPSRVLYLRACSVFDRACRLCACRLSVCAVCVCVLYRVQGLPQDRACRQQHEGNISKRPRLAANGARGSGQSLWRECDCRPGGTSDDAKRPAILRLLGLIHELNRSIKPGVWCSQMNNHSILLHYSRVSRVAVWHTVGAFRCILGPGLGLFDAYVCGCLCASLP